MSKFLVASDLPYPDTGVISGVMSEINRKLRLGLAVVVLAGPWAVAAAMPEDVVVVRRVARIPAPFVPAIDLDSVPGFTKKMRGDRIVYCRTEPKLGTRFNTETCIDQAHMSSYLAALEENRRQVKQIRTGENQIN